MTQEHLDALDRQLAGLKEAAIGLGAVCDEHDALAGNDPLSLAVRSLVETVVQRAQETQAAFYAACGAAKA